MTTFDNKGTTLYSCRLLSEKLTNMRPLRSRQEGKIGLLGYRGENCFSGVSALMQPRLPEFAGLEPLLV